MIIIFENQQIKPTKAKVLNVYYGMRYMECYYNYLQYENYSNTIKVKNFNQVLFVATFSKIGQCYARNNIGKELKLKPTTQLLKKNVKHDFTKGLTSLKLL